MVSEQGEIDDDGHQDIIRSRLTEGDENAQAPSVALPPSYREAADRSLQDESIPPAYREAVKQYFDGME